MPTLEDLWTPSSEIKAPTRWSMDIWGGGGAGKSHFIITTAPGPVYYILLDMRDPAPIIKRSGRKDIFVRDLRPGGVLLTEKQVSERLTGFKAAMDQALKHEEGTLAIDGGSVLANLLEAHALIEYNKRRVQNKKPAEDKLPALQRGSINATINDMLAATGASHMNFAITHQQKEVWADEGDGKGVKPTGTFEARENSQIEYGADMAIRMFSRWASAIKDKPAHMEHYAKIVRCKINEAITQMTVTNPTWKYLVSLLADDEDEDE